MKQINRIEGLDLIRTFAIFSVVLIHCLRCICPLDTMEIFNGMSTFSKIFYFASFNIGSLGVPLFFILSGYLLLPRDFDELKTKKFYLHNFLPLLLTWELWIPANNWLALWYYDVPLKISTIVKNMIFVEPVYIGHSWYMPVILGIYLFIPFVARTFKAMSDREFLIPMAIAYIYFFVLPSISQLRAAHWDIVLDLNFSGGLYGSYVVLGYLLRRFENHLKRSLKLIALITLLIILTTYAQIWIHSSSGQIFHLWYDFLTIPPTAVAIFILLRDMKLKIFSSLVEKISLCSFGMYMIHVFLIGALLKFKLLSFIISDELRVVVLTVVVYVLSFIAVMLLKKLPFVGKILVR